MNRILVFAVVLTFCTPCSAQETSAEKLLAQAEPAIQKQISDLFDSQSKVEVFRQIEALKEIAGAEGKGGLVKQLAIFAATSPRKQEFHVLHTLLILHRLDIQPSIIIQVLSPYVGSENERLRKFAREWFQGYDKAAFEDPFKAYASYVGNKFSRNQKIPAGFIKYLFEQSPDRALLVFNRAAGYGNIVARLMELRKKQEADLEKRRKKGEDHDTELREERARFMDWHKKLREDVEERKVDEDSPPLPPPPMPNMPEKIPPQRDKKLQKEILLAEHIVSNAIWLKKQRFDERFPRALPEAKDQLSKLAQHDEWWSRLYVAEIMRRHRELRLANVLDKLSKDSNALVSKSAKSVGKSGK